MAYGYAERVGCVETAEERGKKQIGLVDMAIKENLYTAYHDVPEMGELIEDNDLVIPQMEEAVACKVQTEEVDAMEVERADVSVSVVDTIHREKNRKRMLRKMCVLMP